jgi:hypothetical protein
MHAWIAAAFMRQQGVSVRMYEHVLTLICSRNSAGRSVLEDVSVVPCLSVVSGVVGGASCCMWCDALAAFEPVLVARPQLFVQVPTSCG